ncbi:MAG: MATE family efflux transporter [Pseudomonadota bacterium]|nr:MATE family efflux transporter [Pseudomonadota bacterium]
MNEKKLTYGLPLHDMKRLVVLAAPIIAAQVMQSLNGFIDTVMAGRHSPDTLSQVAMGSAIWLPMLILSAGVFNGVSALTSHAFGAGDKKGVSQLFASSVLLSVLLSALLVFCLRNSAVVFPLFDVPQELGGGIVDYVDMVSLGFPLLLIFWAFRGWVEGLHHTKPAMIASLASVLLNIPLNYIFIHGWWIVPEMGAKGCGIATAISMSTMPFWMIYLFKKQGIMQEAGVRLRAIFKDWDLGIVKRIVKVGGPVGVSGFIEGSFFCVIAIMLAPLGATSVAAHQITINISGTLFMVPLGFNFALTVAVGKAYGENAPVEEIKRLVLSGLYIAFAFAICSCILLLTCRELIPMLYSNDAPVVALASQLLIFAAIFQIPDGMQVSLYGVLKGLQDTVVPMIIAVFAYWIIGAMLGYSFTYFEVFGAMGAKGAWIGLNIGLVLASVAYGLRMLSIFKQRTGVGFFEANKA